MSVTFKSFPATLIYKSYGTLRTQLQRREDRGGRLHQKDLRYPQRTPLPTQNAEFFKIIAWTPNGREFIIKDIPKFQDIVLPRYFRHRNINSFIRQVTPKSFSSTCMASTRARRTVPSASSAIPASSKRESTSVSYSEPISIRSRGSSSRTTSPRSWRPKPQASRWSRRS